MSNIRNRDVSDPLRHLFSLNFGRSSPLLDEVAERINELVLESPAKGKKVRFHDPVSENEESASTRERNSNTELKGILKNQLTTEEKESAISILNSDFSYDNTYDSDSVSSDDHSSDSSEKQIEELETDSKENLNVDVTSDNVETIEIYDSPLLNSQNHEHHLHPREILSVAKEESSEKLQNVSEIGSAQTLKDVSVNSLILGKNKNELLGKTSNYFDKINRSSIQDKLKKRKHELLPKKKLHVCVVSLANNVKKDSSGSKETKNPLELQTKLLSRRNVNLYQTLGSSQTFQLYSSLENKQRNTPSAKQLKDCVFHAWEKVKSSQHESSSRSKDEETSASVLTTENKKENRSDKIETAFIAWKQKKELSMKRRKQKLLNKQPKPNESTLSLQPQKTDEEERIMVYNLWKQKKNEERKQLQEKLKVKKAEEINKLEEKELQKQEAASAFIAWKESKQKFYEKRKEMCILQIEQQRQKDLEKSERDKEAQEAYVQWLLEKENSIKKHDLKKLKPPWNPPG